MRSNLLSRGDMTRFLPPVKPNVFHGEDVIPGISDYAIILSATDGTSSIRILMGCSHLS